MSITTLSTQYGSEKITIETGKLAKLSAGSVTVRWGDTVVLATTNIGSEPREGVDFFPLMVDYEEKYYAAGKIIGSRFIKREGRPSDNAVLTSRLIDRPIRPLFPKDFRRDIQVIVSVLSLDPNFDSSIAATIAASASLMMAEAPFYGPVAACRLAYINGQIIPHPTSEQLAQSQLDLVVSGTMDSVMMIEAGAHELPEEIIVEAIAKGHTELQAAIKLQQDLAAQLNKNPMPFESKPDHSELYQIVSDFFEQN